MPNVSFDVFFDQDFINVTATRSGAAPKAKPAWKVRSAPKLPPKELPAPNAASPRPTPRPKLTASKFPEKATKGTASEGKKLPKLKDQIKPEDSASQTGAPKPKANPPKPKDAKVNGA